MLVQSFYGYKVVLPGRVGKNVWIASDLADVLANLAKLPAGVSVSECSIRALASLTRCRALNAAEQQELLRLSREAHG